jgi:hypothetical protein
MMDKAIESLPAYSNVKKCTTNNITDAIIILKPILSYQAQSTILYGDLHVKFIKQDLIIRQIQTTLLKK